MFSFQETKPWPVLTPLLSSSYSILFSKIQNLLVNKCYVIETIQLCRKSDEFTKNKLCQTSVGYYSSPYFISADKQIDSSRKKIQVKHTGKRCSSFFWCFWKYSIMLAFPCTTPDHHSFSKVTAESPPIHSLIKSFLGWSSLDLAVLRKSPEPEHFNLQS